VTHALALPGPARSFAGTDPNLTAAERSATSAASDLRSDPVALGAALQREGPILLAAARAMTLDDREAEDLVQTTFELAVRHIGRLREPAAFRSWLLTIQAREAFRVTRRLRRVVRLKPTVSELTVGDIGPGPAHEIRDALGTLPPRMRAAVVLHHMAGLRVAEVAEALGTSENTVKSQLRVGLARLREALGDD
jgi:DNA-directed RNA polymerase specialized sigma24 family protein